MYPCTINANTHKRNTQFKSPRSHNAPDECKFCSLEKEFRARRHYSKTRAKHLKSLKTVRKDDHFYKYDYELGVADAMHEMDFGLRMEFSKESVVFTKSLAWPMMSREWPEWERDDEAEEEESPATADQAEKEWSETATERIQHQEEIRDASRQYPNEFVLVDPTPEDEPSEFSFSFVHCKDCDSQDEEAGSLGWDVLSEGATICCASAVAGPPSYRDALVRGLAAKAKAKPPK
ncbi:expressed unknown protein [Seminavis robusta]|uniref:Uncharacterized protein n=1 Tax=Seminavis robusta TaxID=568900 RepID=A0A9N8EDW7_9STRA|nr:expressed unknown protein [Seminavis robusta]|eukprot:Sro801_g204530.1 n/a (234) ;mRNA; f:33904-34605